MKVTVLNECGYEEAILGLSLSYNKNPEDLKHVTALKLSMLDGGHNKFLESIVVWIDITAPRYWWQEFDTYRVGMTKQSESTMHTLMKRPLTQDNFSTLIHEDVLRLLNYYQEYRMFYDLKATLPESFVQRRVVCTNYKTLRNIFKQRRDHKLPEWQEFIKEVKRQVQYPELLP